MTLRPRAGGAATTKTRKTQSCPRLTADLTEEEVLSRLRQLCSDGRPQDKYELEEELGAGAGGTVYLATERSSGQRVAIKVINFQKQRRKEMILMELKVMKELNHPNLVNYIECYLLGGNLWVVMEYLAGGGLNDVVEETKMKEAQIAAVCKEVCCCTLSVMLLSRYVILNKNRYVQ